MGRDISRTRFAAFLFVLIFGSLSLYAGQALSQDVLWAKTIFVLARVGTVGAGKYAPDAKRAKRQVERMLQKWGRYQLVDKLEKADLVLIVTEGHSGTLGDAYGGLYGVTAAPDVLSDTLAVYKGGAVDESEEPLWKATETGDDWDWPADRVIKKFRKAVEKASK